MMMDDIKLVKYLSGELDDSEKSEVELWLEIPGNKAEFDKLDQLWKGAGAWKDAGLFSAEKSWHVMKERMGQSKRIVITRAAWYAMAASLLVIIGLSLFFVLKSPAKGVIEYSAGVQKLEKPVRLPDGTSVYLNHNTSITLQKDFNRKTRTVHLSGEAFFEVAKNPSRPFIIHTANAEIRVVGTSFNVLAYSNTDQVQVSVQSGVVELYSRNNETSKLRLSVGNEGTLFRKDNKLISRQAFDQNMLAWKTNRLNFRNADMNYIASTLEHAFGKEIRFDAEKFKNCRLTVNFNNQNLDTILEVIKETFGLTVTNQGNGYMLNGPGC